MSTSTITEVRVPEPLVSVQSRVSWGALLAGSVVAIAIYSLLTMLGIAVGFSVSDRLDVDQLGAGAAVWTFVTLLVGMFFGGWVATRCTAGELRSEAILYGIIVWGITSTLLIPLTAAGVGLGSGTALADRGVASLKNSSIPPMLNGARFTGERAAERVGDRIKEARSGSDSRSSDDRSSSNTSDRSRSDSADNSSDRGDRSAQSTSDSDTSDRASSDRSSSDRTSADRNSDDRDSRDRESDRSARSSTSVRDHLKAASWWTFAGTLASMLSAIFGALLGPHVVITHRKYVTPRPVV
ncbi:MAG TPA: hypothetical protein VGI75_02000 [Pirellulales bacterium]|jgi:hypothetical protein